MSAALAGLALLTGLAAAIPRPIQPPAPEFATGSVWINGKGLSMRRLKGRRVVLVAFLNAANLNSLRAIQALKTWDERYGLDGLSIIGVHDAVYGFQHDLGSLKDMLRRAGAAFPVFVDDNRGLWKAYANEGWPAFYLVDLRGRIVYDLLGEGGYEAFESEMRAALDDAGYRVPKALAVTDPPQESCGAATPEVGLGSAARRAASTVDLDAEELRADTEIIGTSRDGETSQHGVWRLEAEALRLDQANPEKDAFVRIICRGAQAFALLAKPPAAKAARFYVRQDGLWLHNGNAGGDVKFDDDGRSYVPVDATRLYWLVKNPNDNAHELRVMPAAAGSSVYGFQFSDRCLTYKP